MLTRKDYEVIARIIKGMVTIMGRIDKNNLVESLSDYFEEDNPNFDRDKFFKACYGKKEE